MKSTELKTLIKEAVREAIQEELKEILLEAVRSPKAPIQEAYQMHPVTVNATTTQTPQKSLSEKKAMYESILNDMSTMSFTSADARSMGVDNNTFRPRAIDQANGALPEGNVGLDQIMGLMNTK
jgi:microcystin degradation protein MlrC